MFCALAYLVAMDAAAAKNFDAFGGRGDAHADVKCPDHQFLVGLTVKVGDWVDQMSITCAPLDSNGATGPHSPGKDQKGGTAFGGTGGGQPKETTCAPDEVIMGVGLLMTPQNRQVRLFRFNCASMKKPTRHDLDIGNTTHGAPSNQRQDCPADEAVTGIKINYGHHVNAIGLMCGRRPEQLPQPIKR
jgi:hypothetical protein